MDNILEIIMYSRSLDMGAMISFDRGGDRGAEKENFALAWSAEFHEMCSLLPSFPTYDELSDPMQNLLGALLHEQTTNKVSMTGKIFIPTYRPKFCWLQMNTHLGAVH
jgi:hypothetical protein